jgi:tetratricopeptide (TPR) repeat protein
MREFEEAIRLNPRLATAHSKLGKAYRKKGRLPEAAAAFAEALRLDPLDFMSALSLGQIYQLIAERAPDRLEKLRLAVRAYQQACDLRADHFEAHLNLGVCYHQLGELDQAIQNYEAALKIDPQNAFAYTNLGAAYDSRGKFYEAIRMYKRALELGDNQPMVLVNLGATYVKQGRFPAAMESFRRAIEMDPNLSVGQQWVGYCNYKMGRYDEALAAYGRAIQRDSKNAEAYAGRGVVYMTMYLKSRRRPELRDMALDHWHHSLELDPNQPRLRALIAKYSSRDAGGTATATLSP